MTGTIKTAFTLRSGWLLAILLTSLWAFNPLGGQASLRMLSLQDTPTSSTAGPAYHTADPKRIFSSCLSNGETMFNESVTLLRTLYGAALFSPDAALLFPNRTGPTYQSAVARLGGNRTLSTSTFDLWGNVRMPVLDMLPGYNSSSKHGRVDVPFQHEIGSYASIIGTSTRGLPTNGSGNFSFIMNSNYNRLSVWADKFTYSLTRLTKF
jgi:hypothetical protein